MTPKLWMTLMAGPGSLQDLRELWTPISHCFSGLVATYHGAPTDPEAIYLEQNKGAGRIVYLPYSGRHDFSRSAVLFCGPIQEGQWVMQADVLERLKAPFVLNEVPRLISGGGVNIFLFHAKPILYQFHESLAFRGSPHEGLIRQDGNGRVAEINQLYPIEKDVRENVRPLKRKDPFHWVGHYGRYYIECPWGTNQCLLGNENRPWLGDPGTIYRGREQVRLAFRDEMRVRGVDLTVAAVKAYFLSRPLDATLASAVNWEKILNDLYRLSCGDTTVVDEHQWTSLRTISVGHVPSPTSLAPATSLVLPVLP